jgi:sarcosine oxidase subunit alpha
MGAVETKVLGGIRGRVFRLSFSGELGFEIAVPARHGERLADALMTAGKPFDMTPYGTEALAVMRIEKGHVSGPELNGQMTLNDLGFGKMGSTRKDYIGRVLSGRPALLENTRLSLVGAVPVDKSQQLRSGAHLLSIGAKEVVENDQGYLSSVTQSPILGHSVGLGFLAGGKARIGERLRAYDPLRGSDVVVEIVAPGFIDPEGVRLRG